MLKADDGNIIYFRQSSRVYYPENRSGDTSPIVKNANGTFTRTTKNGTKYNYSSAGILSSITDKNSNTTTLTYSGSNLASITDQYNRITTIATTGGKITTITDTLGRVNTLAYTGDFLTSINDPEGNTWQYTYDGAGKMLTKKDPAKRTVTYTYDSKGRLLRSIDPEGKTRAMDYLTSGTSTFTEKDGSLWSYTYDAVLAVKTSKTDSLGNTTVYTYDTKRNLIKTTYPDGSSTVNTYDTNSNMTSVTDPLGHTTTYTYNSLDLVTSITDAKGNITQYGYDVRGNRTSITDATNAITQYQYDDRGNLTAIITPLGNTTSLIYDTQGNLLSRQQSGYSGTTAITATTQYTYNSYGRITSIDGPRSDVNDTVSFAYYPNDVSAGNNRANLHTVTDALGHTTTYSDYNVFDQAETVTDPNGIVTTRTYNSSGLVTATTTAGLTTAYAYNATGQLQTITLPGTRMITYTYIGVGGCQSGCGGTPGQIAKITDTLGNAISYTYDSGGRRTGEAVHDPQNTLTRYANYGYDDYGRMTKVTLPGDAQETSEYDQVGNLVKTVNATAMQTGYQYDALGRLLSVTEAGTTTASYAYDAHDNVTKVTDANNKVTSFTYDDFGRRVSRTAPDTGQNGYSYDKAGNLVTATDAKGQGTSFTYDALNRPISQSYAGGDDILFSYDQGANAIGHLSRITDREGTDSFVYDTAGRLVTETRVIGPTSHTTGYSWDATTGELAGMTYPSGRVLSYSRDTSGQISAINIDGAALVSAVTHLPFGPLKSASFGSVNLTRDYDQRYNITKIKAGSLDYIYTRDAGGNVSKIAGIQAPTTAGVAIDYTYNPANNQLTAAAPKAYTYDANGNMLSDGTNTFTYDALNRLSKVEQQGSTIATYGYDSMNRRISKTVGTVTSHYIYDLNSQLIAETLLDGTPLREYIYLDGEPLALREYQTNPGTYYFVNDHLGTPQQLVTATGTLVWQAAYLPFGQAQIKVQTVKNNLRFAGQFFDSETGLHYNLNRYYDPETGRYISADPIGLDGGMNLYAYVSNDPVNWIDPWGLISCHDFVESLIGDWKIAGGNKDSLGQLFLNKRGTTLSKPTGFRPELVAGRQGGAVSRHIYGHAGAILKHGWIIGGGASAANETIDWAQGFQPGRTRQESDAEIADDWAARKVASELENACPSNKADENYLRQQLRRVLCQ
ncbi:MAG: RHS repeat-associated core domain-containing protein [Desulfoprunum sp.]|nr:RHS repeat-associated core domain-containing protein [Desulfoprunum sp.]